MWSVVNCTPFAAAGTWGRDQEGVHEWIVAVRATYELDFDGRPRLADQQSVPLLAPEYGGEPGASSLRYDADLVGRKPTTDIILNGTAYAPQGRATRATPVSMRVGELHKTILARGDRRWTMTGTSAAEPFTRLPITYERAYGGYDRTDPDPRRHRLDVRNPVGRGVFARSEDRTGQLLPNFEYPDSDLAKAGPAGFGAIDSHWSPRRESGGTYDETWLRTRRPLLPRDWAPRALQCAPSDQRPSAPLRGGEPVEVINASSTGVLRFSLPAVELVFRTRFVDRMEEHPGHLSALILEPDVPRFIMVWVSSLLVHTDGEYLEETIVRERFRR